MSFSTSMFSYEVKDLKKTFPSTGYNTLANAAAAA